MVPATECGVQLGITCTETPHGPSSRYLFITPAKALRPRFREEQTTAQSLKFDRAGAKQRIASESATSATIVCSSLCRNSWADSARGKHANGSFRLAVISSIVKPAEPSASIDIKTGLAASRS